MRLINDYNAAHKLVEFPQRFRRVSRQSLEESHSRSNDYGGFPQHSVLMVLVPVGLNFVVYLGNDSLGVFSIQYQCFSQNIYGLNNDQTIGSHHEMCRNPASIAVRSAYTIDAKVLPLPTTASRFTRPCIAALLQA